MFRPRGWGFVLVGGPRPVNLLGNRLMFGSVNANLVDFQAGVAHLEQINRQWPDLLQSIITRRVPFSQFERAYERQPGDVKVSIEMDS